MTEEYAISNGRVFVKDKDEMYERSDVVCEEQLELENEIEILEELLKTAKGDHYKLRDSKKPKYNWLWFLGCTALIFGLNISLSVMAGATLPVIHAILVLATLESLFIAGILHISIGKEDSRYKQKVGLEEQIGYIEEELASRKIRQEALINDQTKEPLEDTEVQTLESVNTSFTQAEKDRLDQLAYLGAYKEELIRHYNDGTLREFLLSAGTSASHAEFIEKRLSLQLANQNNQGNKAA